jgi:hypothetical protein
MKMSCTNCREEHEKLIEAEELTERLIVIAEKQSKVLQDCLKQIQELQDTLIVINMELSLNDDEEDNG